MWARTLRPLRSRLHRTVRFSRGYNGQDQGPHKTYFQPPAQPTQSPRSNRRYILFGSICFVLGSVFGFMVGDIDIIQDEEESEGILADVEPGLASLFELIARGVPVMDPEQATTLLLMRSGFSVTPTAVGHSCQLPSNLPCEDSMDSGIFSMLKDPSKDMATWSIFDGHAGPSTSFVLKEILANNVGGMLIEEGCMNRQYTPNDAHVIQTIKEAFVETDNSILMRARERVESGDGDLSHTIGMSAPALSGSCALMAFFDPAQSILRVANTGDSRAVLGHWDNDAGKYVAQPMSIDQTGFNQEEVRKLNREHPGEDSVDPRTGRVHGIAVSRAFGDSRWKWPNELSQMMHEKFFGPSPRPDGMIKTPPYLTAEPEVMEAKVHTGQHPDFMIMASDGLWDNMTSEDAVTCVHQWLDKYKPTEFLEKDPKKSLSEMQNRSFERALNAEKGSARQFKHEPLDPAVDEETYYDKEDKCMKWRVSPKHFVVEDEHCAVHLIKNALGGSRRNLFCGVMSIQPPLSRNIRDDITVHVIFFGVDASKHVKLKAKKA